MNRNALLAVAMALILEGCSAARAAAPTPFPTIRPIGQATLPLPIATGAPVRIVSQSATPPVSAVLPPIAATGKWMGEVDGLGYFSVGKDGIGAVDLSTGRTRWVRTVKLLGTPVIGRNVIFVPTQNDQTIDTLALSAKTGKTVMRLPSANAGFALDGVVYAATDHHTLSAFDERSGTRLWQTSGGGNYLNGNPLLLGSTLLAKFTDDGAILLGREYAFDVRTGHARWYHTSESGSLGVGPGVVYLEATWFPAMMDNYIPLTIDAVDIVDGTTRSSFTYAPDPRRNAQTYRQSPIVGRVSGGFVYILVNAQWYRYDADRAPNAAHPVSLGDLDIAAWFDNGTILANTAGEAVLAQSTSDAIQTHPVGSGAVRSPIALRADGEQYALVGDTVFAFDPDATAHALGTVRCPSATRIVLWQSHVALLCADKSGSASSQVFGDVPARAIPPPPKIAAAKPPAFAVHFERHDIPPPTGGMMHQWWVGGMAGRPDGSIAFTLQHNGEIGAASAIGVLTRDRRIDVHTVPAGLNAMIPSAVIADASGTLFFNDDRSATVSAMTADGNSRVVLGDAFTPEPVPTSFPPRGMKRLVPGIRLATGSDGQAWYERMHPHAEIGRVDGSRVYPVPTAYGPPLTLREGTDGALWFLTPAVLGRVTVGGIFSSVPLPAAVNPRRWYGAPVFATGNAGTMWIAAQSDIFEMNASGPMKHFRLPNATAAARAIGVGCDGSVYVAEWAEQIDRIDPAGNIEQYPVDLSIDAFMRMPDCSMWVVAGNNDPRQQIARLDFTQPKAH